MGATPIGTAVVVRLREMLPWWPAAEPGDDLLSGVAADSACGDRLSMPELIAMTFLLLVAGHETALHLIGNGVYMMLKDREAFLAPRANPTRAANHDPAVNPEPPRRHLVEDTPSTWASGTVSTSALGATLGRLEANVAFTALLERFGGLRLADPEFAPAWRMSFLRGSTALPCARVELSSSRKTERRY